VSISVNGPSGTKVSSVSATEADVDVSRIRSEVMDIDVIYGGEVELEENEEPIALDLSSTMAEVSCSGEMLGKVDKIAAVLDREDLTDDVKSFTVDLQALDKEGNVIPHVVIEPKEISLDASEGYTKEVNLYLTVKDESDDNYERKYTIPDTVTIKGTKRAINKVSSIIATDVDVSYKYADEEIAIEYNLPDGIYIADESLGQKVKLTVTQKKSDEDE
jgi:YbbR domain-containing protein